ncbi:OmpA family protein [Herminiimonas sp. CN]|uniref:OmpA family protein n=1 Tax=Herminiimonas sp. CN TaxID=1349818 RepID=UPI00047346AF|nr:OmpA family protein [Herminiimonas sp. CN]
MLIKLALGLAIGSTVIGANAQPSDIQAKKPNSAYLQDSNGIVVRSAYGLCWRTGTWLTADAVLGCDGELTPPIANPTAPAIATLPTQAATPAVQPEPQRCDFLVTLENDQTFPFNSTTLAKAAKERIDQEVLPRLARCTHIESIRITGHTDLLGPEKYNQQLSYKRAANLAAYLKSKNITSAIIALGAGATQPVKVCNNKLTRSKLIQCLAPNRRLTIEIKDQSSQ